MSPISLVRRGSGSRVNFFPSLLQLSVCCSPPPTHPYPRPPCPILSVWSFLSFALFSDAATPLCGIASSLPLFSHFLCDEASQWMNGAPAESRGPSRLRGRRPTVVKAKSGSANVVITPLGGRRGGREGGGKFVREGGDRLGFHRIFRCFGDAALPHLSVMCLSCFASTLLSERKTRASRNSILHSSGVPRK